MVFGLVGCGETKTSEEEKGIQVDMFDAALDVNKLSNLMSQAIFM